MPDGPNQRAERRLSAEQRRPFYEGLIARGKLPKVALVAAMRKLLHAAYSVAKNRKPFEIATERARAA